MSTNSDTLRYEIALVGVALIWGVNFPVVKVSLEYVGPLTFNAIRFSLSGVLLGILYLRELKDADVSVSKVPWIPVIGLGLVGHLAYQLLFIWGIDRTTSGNSAFLISSSPLWTALIVWLRGDESFSTPKVAGLLCAFMGACLLVVGGAGITLDSARTVGNVLSFSAAVAWGSYTALSRPVLNVITPVGLAFWTMIVALPFLWLAAILEPTRSGWVAMPAVWLAIVYSGIFSIGIAYVVWNVGIRQVGASRTAVYANMVPVVAFVIGIAWLGESAVTAEYMGAIAILIGLFLVRR